MWLETGTIVIPWYGLFTVLGIASAMLMGGEFLIAAILCGCSGGGNSQGKSMPKDRVICLHVKRYKKPTALYRLLSFLAI